MCLTIMMKQAEIITSMFLNTVQQSFCSLTYLIYLVDVEPASETEVKITELKTIHAHLKSAFSQ